MVTVSEVAEHGLQWQHFLSALPLFGNVRGIHSLKIRLRGADGKVHDITVKGDLYQSFAQLSIVERKRIVQHATDSGSLKEALDRVQQGVGDANKSRKAGAASKPAVKSTPPAKVKTEHSPIQVHVDPITGRGPMAIDTSTFTSGVRTQEGGLRDRRAFWKAWAEKYPQTLSAKHLNDAKKGTPPTVDATWIKHFPEHAPFKGDDLQHHHLEKGAIAIPLPRGLHAKRPFFAIWHSGAR